MELEPYRITSEHPDLDMVVFNSGIQRGLDFSKPSSIDLSSIDAELTTNYISVIHGLKAFLPHLFTKGSQKDSKKGEKNAAVVFVTSGLAIVPLVRAGNYCASKAALHHLATTMRVQLEETNVKVIEILPPAVQSESSTIRCRLLSVS